MLLLIEGLLCAKRRNGSFSSICLLGFALFHFPLMMLMTSSASPWLSIYLLFKTNLINIEFNVVINTHHHSQSFVT